MRQERRIPEKEGLLFLGREVEEVADGLHPFAADGEAFIAVAATAFRIAMGHAVGKSAVLERSEEEQGAGFHGRIFLGAL